jgi:hypothetical protein
MNQPPTDPTRVELMLYAILWIVCVAITLYATVEALI